MCFSRWTEKLTGVCPRHELLGKNEQWNHDRHGES